MNKPSPSSPSGMRGFTIIWFGQFISMLGSGMTGFAISFWLFAETGQAATLTWAIFFFIAPSVLLSPVAGAIVDRTSRKTIMILSDLAAGLVTIALLILFATDSIQIWHLYLGNFISGAFNSFQFPAYSAAVTLMLPKEQYGRASGMIGLAGSASNIMAPAFAGAMLSWVDIEGIMMVDVVTFIVAIATLFVVHIPQPKVDNGRSQPNSLWQDSLFGFHYIWQRPSLFGMQIIFFGTNLLAMVGMVLMVPMILARTNNNEITLASVQSISAVGGVIGGLLMSTWGGPKRKVHGVLIGMILTGLFGQALMGIGQGIIIWATAAFLSQLLIPVLNGSNQAIWQAKVPPEIQGRVFSVRRLIAQITAPLATAITGPLADKIFEPAMIGTPLAQSLNRLIPEGPGAGMALLMVISGILAALVGLSGYAVTAVRHIETLIPDHDTPIAT